MSRGPAVVRNVRHRALGSRTRLRDEVSIPASLYHGGRLGAWLFRNWRRGGVFVGFVTLWALTQSLVLALLATVVLVLGGWTAWVGWRARSAGGGPLSLSEAWSEAQQKRRLRSRWDMACEAAGLLGVRSREAPMLRRVTGNGRGTLTGVVRAGDDGITVTSIQKHASELAEVIGCREVVVVQTGPGIASLAFHWLDPIARVLPLSDLPPAPEGRLAYGIRQDGTVASIKMTQSVLIGGLTRHGKSNVVWALLADALRQGVPVDLYVSDPKGGVELDALEEQVGERIGLLKVRQYAKNPTDTGKMIDAAVKAMACRQAEMKETKTRQIEPSDKNPLVVVILDETLPLAGMLRQGTDSALGRLAYMGAAAGYVVWANSQVGQIDALGRFRDLIPQRICFATPNPQVTDAVLGGGAEAGGAKCSLIEGPGIGFSYVEGDRQARKFRAALISNEETRAIASGQLPKEVMDRYTEQRDRSVERETRSSAPRRTALYRWYHADAPVGSRPGYIGISYDVLQREREHSAALREFMEGDVRREVEWFDDRKSAERAEREAIQREQPLYNKVHNTRRHSWRRSKERVDA